MQVAMLGFAGAMSAVLIGLVVVTDGRSGLTHPASSSPAGRTSPGLYSFDASNQAVKLLIEGTHEREDVSWSPDGTWIASTDTADYLVDVIRWNGGGLRDLDAVSWSPTGSKVAYTNANELYVSDADWSQARLVSRLRGSDALGWAADGGRFVFGSGRSSSCCWPSLYVSRADGSGVRLLWTPPSDGPNASWIDDASWSPNGRRIAVQATINNGVASRNGGEFLYLVNPARRGAKKVSYSVNASFEEWSADGRWLILVSKNAVYRLSTKGGKAQPLCPRSCPRPVFSADGRRFAFVTGSGARSTLWVENVDGSGKQRLAELTKPAAIVWSRDGRELGLTLPEPDGVHSSIAVADLVTNQIKRLTGGSQADDIAGLSFEGSMAAFYRADPASLWVVSAKGGEAELVTTLVSDPELGPCPRVAWSPKAVVLGIANEPCEPS